MEYFFVLPGEQFSKYLNLGLAEIASGHAFLPMLQLNNLFQRLRIACEQLGYWRFFQFITFRAAKKIFDPFSILSYSQFGEDRIIEAFFADCEQGYYVDVGSNHPIAYSNTWKLYQNGWKGICIDPNPDLMATHKRIRPNDIALQRVVSNRRETVEFYFSRESHLISGVGPKKEGHWRRTSENSDIVTCDTVTLDEILRTHNAPRDFELLSVDVEGHELSVLDSIDFGVFRPRLIVIEMHDFDMSKPADNNVYSKLVSLGYRLTSYARPTGFFELY